jgi:hypothetical protein
VEYDRIAQEFSGWSVTEVKKLSVPERRFWSDLVVYRHVELQKRREESKSG